MARMGSERMSDLTPPLKIHGGKHYLAERIIALMPPHLHYVEPFAGGLAVLLAKPYDCISEVVNDRNAWLSNFWTVLRSRSLFQEFLRQCEATPFSEPVWQECRAFVESRHPRDIRTPEECALFAWNFFVHARQSLAGRQTSFAPLSRNRTRRGMNEQASAWLTAIEGLPAVHARLRRVVILCRDALEVIRSQDGPNTLYYCDPPYLHETRTTTQEYGEHEMSEAQHEVLLKALCEVQGAVLLSGYRSELYDDLLCEWTRHDFELPNNAAGGKEKKRMVESLWVRGAR